MYIRYQVITFRQKPLFFSKLFISLSKDEKRWTQNYFVCNISLWIRSRATIEVVFESDYEIKLLVITSGKRGEKIKKVLLWNHLISLVPIFVGWEKRDFVG